MIALCPVVGRTAGEALREHYDEVDLLIREAHARETTETSCVELERIAFVLDLADDRVGQCIFIVTLNKYAPLCRSRLPQYTTSPALRHAQLSLNVPNHSSTSFGA